MFCTKCGYNNPNGAKFCNKCGAPLSAPVNTPKTEINTPKPQTTPTVSPAPIKTTPVKNTTTVKISGKLIGMIVAAVVAVVAIVMIVTAPPTIDMNKYLVTNVSGYDGYGTAEKYIDWDAIEAKYSKKLKFTKDAKKLFGSDLQFFTPMEILEDSIGVNLSSRDHLSNGQEVTCTWKSDLPSLSILNCKLKYDDTSFTVNGLKEVTKIDLFKDCNKPLVKFTGPDGDAKAEFDFGIEDGTVVFSDGTLTGVYKYSWGTPYISFIKDNVNLFDISVSLDKSSGLSNGDSVTLTLYYGEKLLDYGYSPKDTQIVIPVQGRPETIDNYNTIDPVLIKDYITSLHSDTQYRTYSEPVIQSIYIATARPEYVTSHPYLLLVEYTYVETSLSWGGVNEYHDVCELDHVYIDDNKLIPGHTDSISIDRWTYPDIDSYIEKMSRNYVLEQIH